MHEIRKTTYLVNGAPISLPFLEALADEHPETVEPAPASPDLPKVRERRGPREPVSLRSPRMTEKFIRRALGRDPEHTARTLDRIGFEATMKRIERGEG
jgi:hypothetical protein